MALLDFFLSPKKTTANIAKERLQIIVAERRQDNNTPHYLPQMKHDLLEVINKYIQIDPEMLSFGSTRKKRWITSCFINHPLPYPRQGGI